jgi:hypothetical protein
MAQLVNLRFVAIIQVLPRAKNLDGRHSRLPNLFQPKRR